MKVLQFALIGLGAGAIYAMAAQAIVLVYRGSGVLNFASGAMGMIGAELFYQLKDQNGVDYKLALVLGLGAPALIGLGMQVVMRGLRDATGLAKIIATLGLFAGLIGVGLEVFGSEFRLAVSLLPQTSEDVFGLFRQGNGIGADRFFLLAIAALLTLVLTIVYRYSTFGLATSAVAENERATAALGRSPNVIGAINWFLGGLLAGLAAILLAPIAGGPGLLVLDLSLLVIPALAAALIGSFTSFPLTFFGALLVGVLSSEMSYLAGEPDTLPAVIRTTGLARAVPFLVIVVTLVVRGRALPVRGEASARLPELGTGRIRPLLVVTAAAMTLALVWGVFDESWTDALIRTTVVALVVLSLVVVTGYTGQLSIAQFALAGMGAWFAGQAAHQVGMSFVPALVVGVLCTIPVGLIVALPALRTRGVNLAVATMGMAVAIEYLVLRNVELTTEGGLDPGLIVKPPRFLGWPIDRVHHADRYATICIALLALVMILVANLRRGRAGRRMIAVRTNERAAAALGISVFGAKLYGFALGAAIAALGGVLLAFTTPTIVFGDNYSVTESINAVVYAVLGGVGFVLGPLYGSLFAIGTLGPKIFENVLGEDVVTVFQIVGGFGMIAILLQDPNGLASMDLRRLHGLARRLRLERRIAPKAHAALPEVSRERVTPKVLEVRELTVRFGGVVALVDADLVVRPGQVVGLIGPNGAGKTTFIDAATGFVRHRHGDVLLDDLSIAGMNARRRARLGVTRSFQSLELFEDMSVRDNLRTASDRRDPWAYVTDLFRPGDPPLSPSAVAAVEEFGLGPDLDRRPGELSFGRRRLVGIARAVATRPSVLLLDEPAAGLDDDETAELGGLIRRLADDWGIAILLVEHDVSLVLSTCDHVVALDFGRTIAAGTPDEIRHDAAVIAAYLGEPDEDDRAPGRPSATVAVTPGSTS
jgi:ABC-type branched-subunit amino acid transport system ATPase component/ABC-type branched-subunit amino acid transport system permease subunit